MFDPVLLTLVGAAMIAAAVYDVATLTIPNWISLALVVLFPPIAVSAGLDWAAIGIHLAVGFAALAAGVALFAARIIGGGDAKLFAAVALYIGASWFWSFVFAVAFAGGLLAAALLAVRFAARYTPQFFWTKHLTNAGAGIPYGVAIAAGGLAVLPATQLFMGAAH
jgi:prepilin peptidase CpaA